MMVSTIMPLHNIRNKTFVFVTTEVLQVNTDSGFAISDEATISSIQRYVRDHCLPPTPNNHIFISSTETVSNRLD
jgi:hypothetical protein